MADLVTKSTKSVTSSNIDASELWFEQNYSDPDAPDAGFSATFNESNSNHTIPDTPHQKDIISDNNFLGMSETTPIFEVFIYFASIPASDGDANLTEGPSFDG